jgi:UDP:flavonoid glycosyltransferase YjiC (YdhE family)
MSSHLIAAVPIHGHVVPLLPIAAHLVARGDTVRFLTGSRFAAAVSATGATHVALPPDADFDDRDLVARFPEREGMSPLAAIAFDIEHVFVRPGEGQYAAVQELLAAAEADAVIVDPLFLAGALLAELPAEQRPPVLVAGVVPLALPSRDLAPFGLGVPPLAGVPGRLRNGVLRAVNARVLRGAEAAGTAIMRRTLGRDGSGSLMDWLTRADAVLQLSVPSFEYPRPERTTRLEFTGMVTTSSSLEHPRPAWWPDLDGSRPVVHVTQGTIANGDLSELILPTVHGLADEDVLVVVATGGRPVADLGPLPANARAAEFLPYGELFSRTDVFVTNGGYGGVQFALAHGVPVVVAPGKEDKVEVAARVVWSGTGVNLRRQRPSGARVRHGVRRVLSDPGFRAAAARVAAELAAAPGAAGFAAVIDDVVAHHPQTSSGRSGVPEGPVDGSGPVQREVA